MVVSPAHSHIFLGLKDGTVDCFDAERGVLSPYRIRNLWSNISPAHYRKHVPICTDIKLHPFDLNLLLIAHEGGISLYDLRQETIIRSYQLVIPPGAIGSITDPSDASLREERRPSVTCICFRPDGQMFVSGHSDGCFAFWSIEDGEVPILVRTMDQHDAMSVISTDLMNDRLKALRGKTEREPIFRLAWSHFSDDRKFLPMRLGESSYQEVTGDEQSNDFTCLTVLGGLRPTDPIGVHVLRLPNIQKNQQSAALIGDEARSALKDSVFSIGHSIYLTEHTPEDFLLLPKRSPYFDNSFDAMAIVITFGFLNQNFHQVQENLSSRSLSAFSFPPRISEEPFEYLLPAPLNWIGSKGVIIAQILELEDDSYRRLINFQHNSSIKPKKKSYSASRLPLLGGCAKVSSLIQVALEKDNQLAAGLIEEFSRQRRILITVHLDQKIRFWDISLSSTFLKSSGGNDNFLSSSELRPEFPSLMDQLTINCSEVLDQISDIGVERRKLNPTGVEMCGESLDLLINFSNEEFIVYSFQEVIQSSNQEVNELMKTGNEEAFLEDDLSNKDTSLSPVRHSNSSMKSHKELQIASQVLGSQNQQRSNSTKKDFSDSMLVDLTKSLELSTLTGGFFPAVLVNLSAIKQSGRQRGTTEATEDTEDSSLGAITSLSDLGFLAITPSDRDRIVLIDLRKPKVLVSDHLQQEEKTKAKRKVTPRIGCFGWAVSKTDNDETRLPRLMVGYDDGTFKIIKLQYSHYTSIDNWTAAPSIADYFESEYNSKASFPDVPVGIFTFDCNGKPLIADLKALRSILATESSAVTSIFESEDSPKSTETIHCLLFIVTSSCIFVRMNINGPQVLRKTGVSDQPIIKANVFSFKGRSTLLLVDKRRSCYVLGLPKLDLIWKSTLPGSNSTTPQNICIDSSADIFEYFGPTSVTLSTLFNGRDLVYFPEIVVYDPRLKGPDPPQIKTSALATASALTQNLVSWFQGNSQSNQPQTPTRMSGSEVDQILAGPLRAEKAKKALQPPRENSNKKSTSFIPSVMKRTIRHEKSRSEHYHSHSEADPIKGTSSSILNQQQQMERNIDHLNERGERLRELNERFEDISKASNEFVQQAKKVSQQQQQQIGLGNKALFYGGLSGMKSFFK
ncbi:hypothetical protein PPACK8108_LOCUS25588 [Phakopsora pachyrhizi]|uniref:V-SNARE coiled-coil homology domain-containing protein n=1 Tax=Phakopsora pachyrhizi TaxID=170000 RepID=A0AAV0BSA5_PHAPC|nr:hypothetical protein PPACK8108_LOCUS25588 [Phakopsora pachyrhizi]